MKTSKIIPAIFLMAIIILALASCAPVAANYPVQTIPKDPMMKEHENILFENSDLRVLSPGERQWFDDDRFLKIMDGKVAELKEMGAPDDALGKLKKMIAEYRAMEFEMIREMSEGKSKSSFGILGLVFGKNAVLTMTKGVFSLDIVSPNQEDKVKIRDEGILWGSPEGGGAKYRDTGNGPKEIHWKLLADKHQKEVFLVYCRVPQKYEGWKIVNVSLNSSQMAVH